MTCGVTVTLLITLLFFLVNRLRQRKTQAQENQLAMDDQRSMESIGYIGGNIGYIGAGTMDYSYEHGTTHYQFWKPPGSYFTRRDAPPPYEEAIALAMAESSNTCTVSVASSNLCQYPIALMEANAGRNVAASTTNLINININNGENSSATASGENHSCNTEPDSNIMSRSSRVVHRANDFKSNHELNMSFPTINYSITAGASNLCTNQNCDLRIPNVQQDGMLNSKEARSYTSTLIPCSSRATLNGEDPKDIIGEIDSVESRATISSIKHDDLKNNVGNHVEPSSIELRSTGKQYHRTIPKHFSVEGQIQGSSKNTLDSTVDDVNNTLCTNEYVNKNNFIDLTFNGVKRLSCQCPVKHTPISNISSYAVGIDQTLINEMDLATSNVKGTYNIKTPMKQTTFRPTKNNELSNYEGSACRTKQCHSTHGMRSKGNLSKNVRYYDGSIKKDFSKNSYCKPKLDAEAIIGKEKTSEQGLDYVAKSIVPLVKEDSNMSRAVDINHGRVKAGVDISMNIEVIQRSSSINNEEFPKHKTCMEQNPELPPKQYKYSGASTRLSHNSYYSNSKIHTISKPTKENAKFSIHASELNGVFKASETSCTKSLPRNVVHNKTDYMKNYNSRKSAFQQHSNLERSTKTGKCHTLSKEYTKANSRSQNMLTEVVSKIPSVINIPSPLLPETFKSLEQCAVDSATKLAMSQKMTKQRHENSLCYKKSTMATSTNSLMNESSGMGSVKTTGTKETPPLVTSVRCDNSKKHFLTNDNSLDDEYLSECENCKSAHSSRYYLEEEIDDAPQETMTLQRKMPENEEDQQNYYRVSSTLPTNTNKKLPTIKNRESWFTTIPASSSSDEEETETKKVS
uniref:(northern house mosquito) hypothetical protein n=1 Tax=Culex pipiens TaxID=7175 RepID=A0A8D8CZ88_CULPI